jgi:hypothetical protein
VNEADERFAARLAEDVGRVLGEGIFLQEITVEDERAAVVLEAMCLFDGRAWTIRGRGETLPAAASDLIRAAAEYRVAMAWRTLVAPA